MMFQYGTVVLAVGVVACARTQATSQTAAGAAAPQAAHVDDKGQLALVATGETSEGARNAVADANGNVYVADSQQARLLVFASAASTR